MSEKIILLRDIPMFRGLSWKMLSLIAPYLEEIYYEADTEIFHKGEIGTSLNIVLGGEIRIHDDGQPLAVLKARDVFGEIAVLLTETHAGTATTLEETSLLRLEQDILYELMSENIEIAKSLIRTVAKRFSPP